LEDGLVQPTEEGTPQGSPLSPLLSNLVLDELDRELEKRSLPFVRYADGGQFMVNGGRFMVNGGEFMVNGGRFMAAVGANTVGG
jgi:hypothetical protein